MTRRTLLRLAALFSLLAPLPALAQTAARPPAAHAAGYHWRTLVLRHAVPSDILALMHWNGPAATAAPAPFDPLPLTGFPAPSPAAPDGVLRIFALASTNSLLVDATDDGFATVVKLVQLFDVAPKQVQFRTLLVAVPATRTGLNAPNADAARFLEELRRGKERVIPTPLVTTTDGVGAAISFFYPPPTFDPPAARLQLVQAGLTPDGSGSATRGEFRVTPRITAEGTITLAVASGVLPAPAPRTVRAGELTVYEVTGSRAALGERLFLFLRPTILGVSGETADSSGTQSVTVAP